MAPQVKTCKLCGQERDYTDFRLYPGKAGQDGKRYATCEVCNKVERRRKYLLTADPDSQELADINALYDLYRAKGRAVPGDRKQPVGATSTLVAELLRIHQQE